MLQNRLFNSTALAAGCLSLFAVNPAFAQDEADSMMEIEEVVVTGTYLKGKNQFNSPSPLAVIGADNLNQIGASNVADLVQTLTINNGAQNNPDAFTQNGTSGTSNFNLRGLGVASTLVLLNGRRQVVAGTTTNDGIAFVDTSSLVPQIAVQRIEIVKDGAAAIYGTDAVAGVVNFITDDQFEGVQVSAKYQMVTDEGSQNDQLYEAKFGFGGENTHIMGAFSYYDRSPLTTAERRFSQASDDSSVLGNPGSYYVPSIIAAVGQTVPVIDPYGCEEFGGIPDVAVPLPNGLNVGTCGLDFGSYYSLVPEEERKQAYAVVTQDLGEGHQLRIEGGWADTSNDFRAAISVAACYELNTLSWGSIWTPSGTEPKAARKLASPVTHVKKDMKPLLILHSDNDRSVPIPNALLMVEALKKAGLDMASPAPYRAVIQRMDRLMDEMEALLAAK